MITAMPIRLAPAMSPDDTGTTVSLLAERARMTKQAMAELVRHLEAHGYVRRVPDPTDGSLIDDTPILDDFLAHAARHKVAAFAI